MTLSLPYTIPPLDEHAAQQAAQRQDRLTKPTGALGQLEKLSIRLAAMTGRLDYRPDRRAVLVFAGDHGVTQQGISAYPADVTAQMVLNFLNGGAAINVFAAQMGARLRVIDAGVASTFSDDVRAHPAFIDGKIAHGTQDFSVGMAMTSAQAQASLALGARAFESVYADGLDIIALGEMGIGNSTSASAIIAAITGSEASLVTGRGTGITDETLSHKITLIERALTINAPAEIDTLMRVGGFEIGAIAGAIIAAAANRVPVVLNGLICTAGALIAAQIQPAVLGYLIAGHRGAEPGHRLALEHLGLDALLALNMRLGEGTGAVLAFPLIEAAMRALQEMATFSDAGVSDREGT
ncbi:MAG: nicotinate-nucleotide--dimethylbenzimidazole phosphoribosyltransferase [Pleurocapsa minor GSE-CHR-MK-17-07R]|jgi:nicotinate-nucleotide--dimethylbenzimidazole phosphoribosyltransferase|nr:nicotinate-nucleotide--dimethylbenzimidazole phosphoribosyltransferase [Pleurocapsa minor GSE-CHR-MK 17-07R]